MWLSLEVLPAGWCAKRNHALSPRRCVLYQAVARAAPSAAHLRVESPRDGVRPKPVKMADEALAPIADLPSGAPSPTRESASPPLPPPPVEAPPARRPGPSKARATIGRAPRRRAAPARKAADEEAEEAVAEDSARRVLNNDGAWERAQRVSEPARRSRVGLSAAPVPLAQALSRLPYLQTSTQFVTPGSRPWSKSLQ